MHVVVARSCEGCLSKAAFLFCLRPAGQFNIFSLPSSPSYGLRPLTYIFVKEKSWLQILMWVSTLLLRCVLECTHILGGARGDSSIYFYFNHFFLFMALCVSRALLESHTKIDFHAFWLSSKLHIDSGRGKNGRFFRKILYSVFAHTRHSFACRLAHTHSQLSAYLVCI